ISGIPSTCSLMRVRDCRRSSRAIDRSDSYVLRCGRVQSRQRLIAYMAEPNSSFRLLGNSAWNAAAFLLGVGLNLLILPFVVSRLGLAAFGVAGLVTACVAPAQAFSGSLALSTARELAQRLAPDVRED